MPINPGDSNPRSIDSEQAASAIFRLLAHHRRRFAVQYLIIQNSATSVSDVVDHIIHFEGDDTDKHREQIDIDLVHNHLPMLAEAGIIRYNPDRETVELDAQATDMRPYLDLTAAD